MTTHLDQTQCDREPVNMNQCVVCLEGTANTVMYRCGHLCACLACALDLKVRLHATIHILTHANTITHTQQLPPPFALKLTRHWP
jgi:hypothetical protein